MATRANGHAGVALEVQVRAIPEEISGVRRAARAFAVEHGVIHPDDVAIAISEVCTNVVVHAYADGAPGSLTVSGAPAGSFVWFVIRDHGSGPIPRPDSPGLGMGLPIIAQVADHFEIGCPEGGGTSVRLGFKRHEGTPDRADAGTAGRAEPQRSALEDERRPVELRARLRP